MLWPISAGPTNTNVLLTFWELYHFLFQEKYHTFKFLYFLFHKKAFLHLWCWEFKDVQCLIFFKFFDVSSLKWKTGYQASKVLERWRLMMKIQYMFVAFHMILLKIPFIRAFEIYGTIIAVKALSRYSYSRYWSGPLVVPGARPNIRGIIHCIIRNYQDANVSGKLGQQS